MQGKLRCAVVGCGAIGRRHAAAVRDSRDVDLVVACGTDVARTRTLSEAAYTDVGSLLMAQRLDVVFVATPDHLHVEPMLAALAAGCAVFCEKPLAMDTDGARQMTDAAVRAGKGLAVDYNRRYGFSYAKAHALVRGGRIGEVTHAVLRVTDSTPPFVRGRGPHAFLFSMLTNHIDLMRWVCGEVVSVHARCSRPDKEGTFLDAVLSLSFAVGAVGAVGAIVGGWRDGQNRTIETMEVGGTRGAVAIEDVQKRVRLHGLAADTVEEFQPDAFCGGQSVFYDSLSAHVLDFLARVACGDAPLVTGADGMGGLEIVTATIEFHRSSSALDV